MHPPFLFCLAKRETGRARSKEKNAWRTPVRWPSVRDGVGGSVPAPIWADRRARLGLLRFLELPSRGGWCRRRRGGRCIASASLFAAAGCSSRKRERQRGEPLTYAVEEAPKKGTVQIDGDSFTYTPKENASGTDHFTYTATDASGRVSQPAEVTVTIEKAKSGVTYADIGDSAAAVAPPSSLAGGWHLTRPDRGPVLL